MATKILIPTPLRPYTDKQEAVEASGTTIGELLADLTTKYGGLKASAENDKQIKKLDEAKKDSSATAKP